MADELHLYLYIVSMRGDYNIIGINLPKMIMFAFYCFRYYYYYFAQEIFYNITTCFLNLSNSISRPQLLRLLAIVLKFRQQDQNSCHTILSSPVAVELLSGGYTYIYIAGTTTYSPWVCGANCRCRRIKSTTRSK